MRKSIDGFNAIGNYQVRNLTASLVTTHPNDLVFAAVTGDITQGVSIRDSYNLQWKLVQNSSVRSGTSSISAVYYAVAPNAISDLIRVSFSSRTTGGTELTVLGVSNASTTNPIDISVSSGGDSKTPVVGMSGKQNEMIIGFTSVANKPNMYPEQNFTNLISAHAGAEIRGGATTSDTEYEVLPSSQSGVLYESLSNKESWSIFGVAVR